MATDAKSLAGQPVPAFALDDLSGESWSQGSFAGKPTILFCFASWCTCREQLPGWQHYWDSRNRDFQMVAGILDAKGEETARPTVESSGAEFPVMLDPTSSLGTAFGSQVVPFGVFVDSDGIVRMIDVGGAFDIGDPRVRMNLERFLAGEPVEELESPGEIDPRALELFAEGVSALEGGDREGALALWREGLEVDPDNFIIRSQIWSLEHPEKFWPEVDVRWQEEQLLREGYDKPLP
ncbi:MAG: TlpA family protein disulfide reductase [Solirubrobacterales bacterium]